MRRLLRLWPFAVFVMCFYAYVAIVAWWELVNSNWLSDDVHAGAIFGFLGALIPIGALAGRHWMTGWLISLCLVVLMVPCAFIQYYFNSLIYSDLDPAGFVLLIPLLSLSIAIALMPIRNLYGWSLLLNHNANVARKPASVEDIFMLGVMAAVCVTIFGHGAIALGNPPQGLIFIAMANAFALGAFVGVPLVLILYANQSIWRKLGWWLLLYLVVVATTATISKLLMNGTDELSSFFLAFGVASVVVGGACALLHLSGVRLVRSEKIGSEIVGSEIVGSEKVGSEARQKSLEPTGSVSSWYPRTIVAVSIGVASVFTLSQMLVDTQRLAFWTGTKQMLSDPEQHLAEVWAPNSSVAKLVVDSQFNNQDLARIAKLYPQLNTLSLAGSSVTGPGVEVLNGIEALNVLDLSDIKLSDEDLARLRLPTLHTLSLAGTGVSLKAAINFARENTVFDLDLSRLGITDQQLTDIEGEYRISQFALAGNPISDAGLAGLKHFVGLSRLDLSNTEIIGTGLVDILSKERICFNLDGTKITDASIAALLNTGNLRGLSLRDTAITPAVLPAIAGSNLELRLGKGLISESDLMNLPAGNFSILRLNDAKFTGACLTSGRLNANFVDLSHSSVDEAVIKQVRSTRSMAINLSHTKVPLLAIPDSPFYEVIYHGNPVNLADLLQASQGFYRIYIRSDQLSPKQISELFRIKASIALDNDLPF